MSNPAKMNMNHSRKASGLLTVASAVTLTAMLACQATASLLIDPVVQQRYDERTSGAIIPSATTLYVGDSSQSATAGNSSVFGSLFEFDISGDTAAILAATQITFEVRVADHLGSPLAFKFFEILNSQKDGVATLADYDSVGAELADFPLPVPSVGTTVVVDVTSAVQADALAGRDYSGFIFKLQATNARSLFTNNLTADLVSFERDSAVLNVIPEPASLALVGLGGLMLLGRRSRR